MQILYGAGQFLEKFKQRKCHSETHEPGAAPSRNIYSWPVSVFSLVQNFQAQLCSTNQKLSHKVSLELRSPSQSNALLKVIPTLDQISGQSQGFPLKDFIRHSCKLDTSELV